MSWAFHDDAQTVAFQDHSNAALQNHFPRPICSTSTLPWLPTRMGAPTLDQPLGFPKHQQLQAAPAAGLPMVHQHSAMENTTFGGDSSPKITHISAPRTLSVYSTQTAPNTSSMLTDMTAMPKVIPNAPLKLQQKIIQGEFIYLSQLLQTDFQFKYALMEANDAFELVHKDDTLLIWPRKKSNQVNSLSTWSFTWALYEQVTVYVHPQNYSELSYYRNFIMQQDKKFNWSAVQMYGIRFWAMCVHHICPFTTMDQALMVTILDATAVNTSAWKCLRCGGFNHLVDGCPFPQAALLEMVETTKKGI